MLRTFLLLNPIYVTLFWCIALSINKKSGNTPKHFLGKFMAMGFVLYVSHLFYYLPMPEVYHYFDPIYQLCNLLVFPMYYIYIRLVTVDDRLSWRRHGHLLLPGTVMAVFYAVGVLCMSKSEHINYLYDWLPAKEKLSGIFLYQKTLYIACRVVFIAQGVLYLWLSCRLVKCHKAKIKNFYANATEDGLSKVKWMSITLLVTMSCGIALSILGKEKFMTGDMKLLAPSIVLSVMLFIIGLLGNKQRRVSMFDQAERDARENEKLMDLNAEMSRDEHALAIRQRLLYVFDTQKIYLNPELTIWDVSRAVGSNRTYISGIMNHEYNQNFSTFVNTYRARYAQSLMEKHPSMSRTELAEMSGFGSLASMNRAFRGLGVDF